MEELEFALDKIGPTKFEQLAAAHLRLEGYDVHESGHTAADGGWDARVSMSGKEGIAHASVRDDWRQKIREDAKSVSELEETTGKEYDLLVFVTNQQVTGQQMLDMEAEIRNEYGWDLRIESRSKLLGEININHPKLARDYLGVDPETDQDQLDDLLELQDERIKQIRNREGPASDLQLGPVVALHVIPTGVFDRSKVFAGKVPKPPLFWRMTIPYAETKGKKSFAQDTGRHRRDEYRSYGLLKNNGLYESAKHVGFYEREDEIQLPLNVSRATPGFDAYVVITARRVVSQLVEMGFTGSAMVSVAILDAANLVGDLRPNDTRGRFALTEAIGADRYVTDPTFVDIEKETPLDQFEQLLDEVWRQLGRPEGTENIEEGEWVGNGVESPHSDEWLLGGGD